MGNIIYEDLGVQDKTWSEVKSICDNLGSYRLPTPDSQEYHDALVALAGDKDVAIGFSDEKHEGVWINVYTGTIKLIKLLLIN